MVEAEVSGFVFDDSFAIDRESLCGDVVVLPVVETGSDHPLERLTVVDGEEEDTGNHCNERRNDWHLTLDDLLECIQHFFERDINALLRASEKFILFDGELTQLTVGDNGIHLKPPS